MSAFTCNRSHVAALAAYYANSGHGSTIQEDEFNKTFALFDRANAASIHARYGDPVDDTMHHHAPNYFRASELAASLSPEAILKAAKCFEYQSCEDRSWENSTAHQRVQTIINQAVSELPGYKSADWELPDTLPEGNDGPVRLFA